MALGGLAPIIIFRFNLIANTAIFNAVSGIPLVGASIAKNIGLPIPFYLDEQRTGILVNGEDKSMEIQNNTQNKADGSKAEVTQRGIDSTITINLTARKDSLVLAALIAMADIAFQKTVSKEYSISYLNGPVVIFDTLLAGVSLTSNPDNTKVDVSVRLSRAQEQTTKIETGVPVAEKVTATIPNLPR